MQCLQRLDGEDTLFSTGYGRCRIGRVSMTHKRSLVHIQYGPLHKAAQYGGLASLLFLSAPYGPPGRHSLWCASRPIQSAAAPGRWRPYALRADTRSGTRRRHPPPLSGRPVWARYRAVDVTFRALVRGGVAGQGRSPAPARRTGATAQGRPGRAALLR